MIRNQTIPHQGELAEVTTQRLLWVPMVCAWLLMLATFSMPEDDAANSLATLNMLGMVKLGIRVIALGLLGIAILQHWNHPNRSAMVQVLLPLGLFAVWAVLSTCWSPLRSVSLGQASGLVVLIMLAFVLGLAWNGSGSSRFVLGSLSIGFMLLSTILLLAYCFFPETESLKRDGSGLFHSTNAGGTASLGLLVLIASRLLWNWRWSRLLLLPGIAIHTAVFLLAASRAPVFFAAALMLVMVFVFTNRTFMLAAVVAGSLAGVIYLALDTNFELAQKALEPVTAFTKQNQTITEMSELSGRFEMWQAMLRSHRQSPWIGHGYFVTSRTGELEVWYGWANWTAHNLILQVLVSTGIVGLGLFVIGMLSPAWLLLRRWFSGRTDRTMVYFLLIIGCWYFLRSLLATSFMGPVQPESVCFFSILGIGIGSLLFSQASQDEPQAARQIMPSYRWGKADFVR